MKIIERNYESEFESEDADDRSLIAAIDTLR